ncbi:MAG: hypothetical protein VKJ24_18030 [Synechococcales bacterium]|nr:hypothetical protein [Synechococcales bacterium]
MKFWTSIAVTFTLMLLLLVSHTQVSQATAPMLCTKNIQAEARKLLTLHAGADDRISINSNVKLMPSLTNPVNRQQKFLVYEIWGNIYKGRYRMRFLYYPMADRCVMMGQEILEYASL